MKTNCFFDPGSVARLFWIVCVASLAMMTSNCRTVIAAPPPCPPLEEPAEDELIQMCGPDLSQCPMLEIWLGDIGRHCDAIAAQR